MVDVYVGQTGRAVVKMRDAEGRETDVYDKTTNISYSSSNDAVVSVVDDDAEPKDCRLQALVASPDEDVFITCTFDGDPGDGVRGVVLQSEAIRVLEPPPGEAVSGEFTVEFAPLEP